MLPGRLASYKNFIIKYILLTTERASNCIVASLSALRRKYRYGCSPHPLPTDDVLKSLCCKAAMFKR